MGASETDDVVSELYLVPPGHFVAARDELVRKAREAGLRELAYELQTLRRPTLSAWLVNLLTRHDPARMESLSELGRQLRHAQTRLNGAQLRRLSAQRKPIIADLVDRARRLAVEAGLDPTDKVLSEVEETLQAALVDLAASSTALSGRLVRPMSHSGFGPMPHVDQPPTTSSSAPLPTPPRTAPTLPPTAPPPAPGSVSPGPVSESSPAPAQLPPAPAPPAAEPSDATERWTFWPVEDERWSQPQPQPATAEGNAGQPVQHLWPRLVKDAPHPPKGSAASNGDDRIRRAEAELAAAESTHWQREQELADAQAAVEAAQARLQWLDQQRREARAGKATAERHLSAAQAAQRSAVRAVAEARRALHEAETRVRHSADQPMAGNRED